MFCAKNLLVDKKTKYMLIQFSLKLVYTRWQELVSSVEQSSGFFVIFISVKINQSWIPPWIIESLSIIHDSTRIGSLSPYNTNKVKMTIYTVFVVHESFEKWLTHRAIPFFAEVRYLSSRFKGMQYKWKHLSWEGKLRSDYPCLQYWNLTSNQHVA